MAGDHGLKKWKWVVFFLAPSLTGLLIFIVYPIFASIGVSLTDWTLPRDPNFIGLANFEALFRDPKFWSALQYTLIFIGLYVPMVFIISLGLALLLNQKLRGMMIVRVATFMPVVASWVVVSLIWKWIFNPSYGPVNALITQLGFTGPDWLYQPGSALIAIVLTSVWKDIGYTALLYLGGLQGISESYYEAARIDGAGRWQSFRHITLPMLTPTMLFVTVTLIINYFQLFDQVWLMPVRDSAAERQLSVMVVEIVRNAFAYNRMGYASAMSWVLFLIIFAVTFVQLRVQKRWVYYEVE
jgi:multiple sugar transport system permease protein